MTPLYAVLALVMLSMTCNYPVWRMIRADKRPEEYAPPVPAVLVPEVPVFTLDWRGLV